LRPQSPRAWTTLERTIRSQTGLRNGVFRGACRTLRRHRRSPRQLQSMEDDAALNVLLDDVLETGNRR
jgi:hypothetical protein